MAARQADVLVQVERRHLAQAEHASLVVGCQALIDADGCSACRQPQHSTRVHQHKPGYDRGSGFINLVIEIINPYFHRFILSFSICMTRFKDDELL